MSSTDSVTAQEYIESQETLENEARRIMPYDPNECTYHLGELRQPVFACLTCSRQNNNTPIGVCYSCSIQCHSTHEIVELFSKRRFVCDCGTSKMGASTNGACGLRQRQGGTTPEAPRLRTGSVTLLSLLPEARQSLALGKAEDIPSLSNEYNHNFHGLFCCCNKPYNPLEETGNMIQCYFGFNCGEDWYHEECILGYKRGLFKKVKDSGNMLDKLSPPGEDATDAPTTSPEDQDEEEEVDSVPRFPDLDDFDLFICWKCVDAFKDIFVELAKKPDIVYTVLPHFEEVGSVEEWEKKYDAYRVKNEDDEPKVKRIKTEAGATPYSVFLSNGFRDGLTELNKEVPQTSRMGEFLENHKYLFEDDPVFEPPEDDDDASTGSIFDLATDALLSLPREQAIEGLQAYDKIRSKLKDFFKPFAEQGKVVTEKEVRDFFGSMEKK
ncbi:uncharacterized protein CANTADRAFT_89589 [Suhomyces tanzawaensis NRRL Y-17324]|uniref:UBR-type domain-containing protein n=1 Tax=Suhomyces tanzawaensis NRRL Y-17324 TaxID=984487 RepID=A0A1E4SKN7_9ASCO|nr:uncharacterized protein CANTADRAFT_89589 [Suhomyces tanzawaensis NRRL Y-17324]ODV79992.1 hypothetical protein CANTADRAFT_89589 [Suhomyces tanzawaensis NRRL Y-17324]